jgi:hypothetical protein
VQWAYEQGLSQTQVVSVDTGWAGEGWLQHVARAEQWAQTLGFAVTRLVASPNFSELMQQRQAFPSTKFQWCANVLKGSTLLSWLDKVDPEGSYQVLIGHRRASSRSKQNLPAHIPSSEAFGERSVYYPLIELSTDERNLLLERAGFTVLPHRSLECDPCVNSTLVDLARIPPAILMRQEKLEDKLYKKMLIFPVKNAEKLTTSTPNTATDVLENMGCGDFYGCGI